MSKFTAAAMIVIAAILIPLQSGQAEEPKRGGTLNMMLFPEPGTIMYGLSQRGETQMVAGKIYEGLLTYDFDLTPKPWLAKSWDISSDGLTYTFQLRNNVKWHDGKAFTADDVVFTTTEFLPETSPRARSTFRNVASVKALDDHTVQFTMKTPFPPFMTALNLSSVPILPAHIYRGTDFRKNPMNDTPVGTGPFKFSEWKRGTYIHLVRNDAYWRKGKPYLDEIYFHIIPDGASRATALETGRVDVARGGRMLEYFDVVRLGKLPGIKTQSVGEELLSAVYQVWMNHRKPPFNDRRFRQAVYHAIDRNFIRNSIYFGYGNIATGPVASFTPYYEPKVKKYGYDLDKARALLDEMGLKPDADGIRARIEILPRSGELDHRIAEYVRQQLKQIGVAAKLHVVDRSTWAKRLGEFDFDMTFNLLSQLGDPAIGVARTYHSGNVVKGTPYGNNTGYNNPRIDELFDKAAVTIDPKERQRLYSEAQRILVEDAAVVWLIETRFPQVYHEKVKNLVTSTYALGDSFADVYLAQ